VSNGPLLDYGVCRARNRKAAKAFLASLRKQISSSMPAPAPKLGDAGFESGRFGAGRVDLYVLVGSQVPRVSSPSLQGVSSARAEAIVLATARKIVPQLR
jgi:hypothetical protein